MKQKIVPTEYGDVDLRIVETRNPTACALKGEACVLLALLYMQQQLIAGLHMHAKSEVFVYHTQVPDVVMNYEDPTCNNFQHSGPYPDMMAGVVNAAREHQTWLAAEASKQELDRADSDASVNALEQVRKILIDKRK